MWASVKFIRFVLKHKWYVLVYGIKVGGIPLWQLLIHDLSKFSRAEFGPYKHKHATGTRSEEYKNALWRHLTHNPHHWEYWLYPDGSACPMPEVYVREMVADWQAANKNYGHISLKDWFARNYPRMRLHPRTIEILIPLIAPLGLTIPEKKGDVR